MTKDSHISLFVYKLKSVSISLFTYLMFCSCECSYPLKVQYNKVLSIMMNFCIQMHVLSQLVSPLPYFGQSCAAFSMLPGGYHFFCTMKGVTHLHSHLKQS